jgi:hypothetical protein
MNNGDGTFATKVDYTTAYSPGGVTVADFNGDGKADIAAGSGSGTGKASVLMNNGDGTFATKVDYTVGNYATGITSADFNGDGKPDLAVPCSDSQYISVLINNGNGTFTDVDYPQVTTLADITSADFNGDGKPDMALLAGSKTSIILNTGAAPKLAVVGSSSVSSTLTVGGPGYNTAAAALYVGKDVVTGRSINAAGSVNANGADYAEWIPWSGDGPPTGSVVTYKGSSYVVSSKDTAAFVGNDIFSEASSRILVTFAGQVPVRVTGAVHEGDLLVPNGDGTAKAVSPDQATLQDVLGKVAIAQESNNDIGIKLVKAAVGTSISTVSNLLQQGSNNFSWLNVAGNVTIGGNLIVAGDATFQGNITVAGHIISGGNTPTTTVLANTIGTVATGASCTVSGTDTAGTITVNVGTSGGTSPTGVCQVNFSSAFGSAPTVIIGSANNAAADQLPMTGATTTSYFQVNTRYYPTGGDVYVIKYIVVQ